MAIQKTSQGYYGDQRSGLGPEVISLAAKRPGRYRIGAKYFSTGWGWTGCSESKPWGVFVLKKRFQHENCTLRFFFYKSGLKFGISKVPSSDYTTVYPIISHDIYGYYIRNFQFSNPSLLQLDNAKRRFLSKFCLSGAMGASRGTVLVRQMSGGKPVAEPWCRCEWLVAGCCRKESSKTAKKHIFTAWKCCLLGPCVSEEGNHLESSGTSK